MSFTVIHLNENHKLQGGVEVYISQLSELLSDNGIESLWFGIKEENGIFHLRRSSEDNDLVSGNQDNIFQHIHDNFKEKDKLVFHLHSLYCPVLTRNLLSKYNVVRTMHGPPLFCPGRGKYWRFSEKVCTKTFGFHCIYHTYTQGCCNRHPKRLLKAIQNTKFELNEAVTRYKSLIAVSNYIKEEAALAGINKESIEVLNNFTNISSAADALSRSEPKSILFAGRIIDRKGLHHLIEAAIPILQNHPEACINVAGEGQYYSALTEALDEADNAGIKNRIIFHGWTDRKKTEELLKKTHLVVVPSLYPEAFGIIGIEAMMYGKPVVAYNVGGIPDWLENGKTGILVKQGDKKELGSSISRLIDNNNYYEELSANSASAAKNKFSSETHITKLMKIYEKALQ
jgi:glycosyltransferase involved in cell wall biosynthesis